MSARAATVRAGWRSDEGAGSVLTLAVGAAGGERSGAVTIVGGEWLPAGSVCTTVTGSPSNTAGGSAIE